MGGIAGWQRPQPSCAALELGPRYRRSAPRRASHMRLPDRRQLIALPTELSIGIRPVAIAALLALAGGCAISQPALLPTRSEPHEALAFYEGVWTLVDGKPEQGFRETCSWLAEGRRHMVCKARWQAANGPQETLGIYSHDPSTGDYQFHGFAASGAVIKERVQRHPKGWVYTTERGTGVERVRTRETLEETVEGRVSAVHETAKNEGPWVVDRKVEYLRTRP